MAKRKNNEESRGKAGISPQASPGQAESRSASRREGP